MNNTLLFLHSWLRWVILIVGFITVFKAIGGLSKHRPFLPSDNKSTLFFMIFMDIQFLVGIVLYFTSGWSSQWKSGMQSVMSQSYTRFFTVEHATMMILAWILVHIGRAMVKKGSSDAEKHKKALIFFGVALLLILLAIPWPFRHELGNHPWFRI